MNIYDKSGWLFQGDVSHGHEITEADIDKLLELGAIEDEWTKRVQEEADYFSDYTNIKDTLEMMVQQIRITNIPGAIVQFPFGYFCTFKSRRHLFRGENQMFAHTESTLGRRCRKKDGNRRSERDIEILHVISNMRIAQFRKFIWQFDIIPQWEGKLSEINYKALAQHYGLDTFLLDLTNDIRTALFFATCKWSDDHFEPLTKADIQKSPQSRYGVIYHSPDWKVDSLNGEKSIKQFMILEKEMGRERPSVIDTGRWDGIAYQIGLQPFHRCLAQHGYVYPMKTIGDIQDTGDFEKIYFQQSEYLSRKIYDMMDGGKKIYPEEGIIKAQSAIEQIRNSVLFSEDDLLWAYELDEARKDIFSTIEELQEALESDKTGKLLCEAYGLDKKVEVRIQKDEVTYEIAPDVKNAINIQYNNKDFLEPLKIKKYYRTPGAIEWRKKRYQYIFGEESDID